MLICLIGLAVLRPRYVTSKPEEIRKHFEPRLLAAVPPSTVTDKLLRDQMLALERQLPKGTMRKWLGGDSIEKASTFQAEDIMMLHQRPLDAARVAASNGRWSLAKSELTVSILMLIRARQTARESMIRAVIGQHEVNLMTSAEDMLNRPDSPRSFALAIQKLINSSDPVTDAKRSIRWEVQSIIPYLSDPKAVYSKFPQDGLNLDLSYDPDETASIHNDFYSALYDNVGNWPRITMIEGTVG